MSEVDLDGPEPIYRQIAAVIQRRIRDGQYLPNRAIPAESALMDEFDVSRNTIRAALKVVVEAGLARTVPGKGTYALPVDHDA